MITSLRSRLGARSDDGAMLIFALILITTIALVTGALLTTSGSKFATTVALRKVAGTSYASDAAAKIAINDLVYGGSSSVSTTLSGGGNPAGTCGNSGGTACYPNGSNGTPAGWVYDNNTDGTGCFGKSTASGNPALDRITLSSVYTDSQSGTSQSATVVCKPVFGTGLFGSGGGVVVVVPNASDPFAQALTTVGTTTCTLQGTGTGCDSGMTLKGLGSGSEIPVRGSIQSKTSVNVSAGTLRTNGIVTCSSLTGSIITLTGNSCSGSFVTPTTPSSPLSSVPTWMDPSDYDSSPAPGNLACDFPAGFYSNGLALSNAVNSCTSAHFQSGKYYFDFADGNPWDIATTVVGGQSAGGASIPGKCVSPIDSPSTAGVQFVFGGSSYIQVEDAGNVELCGPSNGGAAPLTVFQQQDAVAGSPANVPTATAGNVVDAAQGGQMDAFRANPASCKAGQDLSACVGAAGDGKAVQWSTNTASHTGEIDLKSFTGLANIPPGSTITAADLKVTYAPDPGFGTPVLKAGVTGQAGTVVLDSVGAGSLTNQVNSQFQASPTGFKTVGPTVQVLVSGSNGNNSKNLTIDKVTLAISYIGPGLRAPTGPATFITDHGGNFAGKFVVQGATYAPKGYITLTPGSSSNALVAFRWGIVAWGVNFKSLPSQVWGYPLISIPDISYGFGSAVTAVDLSVYLCSGSGPCSTTGNPALTSRVQITDPVNGNNVVAPVPGERQVNVLSWAEQH